MGLLDSVIGGMVGGGGTSPVAGVLMNMLGGGGGVQGSPMGGLVSQFEQAGLAHLMQSWIGNGQNLPVSPQQLMSVFGGQLPQMANQAGMSQGDLLAQLSQHLPGVINALTPNGRLPDAGSTWV